MGNSRTTTTLGEFKGQIGPVSISIGNIVVRGPAKAVPPARVIVQYVSERGHLINPAPDTLYYVPPELVKTFAARAGEAGMTTLKIRVLVNPQASMRKQTRNRVTLGTAFIEDNKAEVYWKNIYWQKGDSLLRQTFLSVVAHEVGHLVHYNVVGDSGFYSIPRIEREYAAERFVELVLGKEYVRPVEGKFYRGY